MKTAKSTPSPGLVAGLLIAGLMLAATGGVAHIVNEEPWHPVPAAYLRSLFYANLKPIPWHRIASEYDAPLREPGFAGKTVYELLAPAQAVAGIDHAAAIRRAIAERDRGALYDASTRAVAQLVRSHLERAAAALDRPAVARSEVLAAQRIYRAFADPYLEAAAPEVYRHLGRTWLELTSSIGSPGVLGAGATPPERQRFARASSEVLAFLRDNYEVARGDAGRGRLMPLPAAVDCGAIENDGVAGRLAVLPPGSNVNDQDPLPLLRLNFEARGHDERDLFMVAYGDMVFDSPRIFGEPARSLGIACSTCHNRSDVNRDFFIPGLSHKAGSVDVDGEYFNPRFNDQRDDPLDIPTLRGLRFTAPYGRDGRFASLRDFVRNVIVNEFGGPEPTPLVLDALVAYLLEFDWLPSPYLLPDGRLNDRAPEAARRGEALFNKPFPGLGGRACATCHVPSANFIDRQVHDVGSGDPSAPGARDSFFDTPTLINVKYTAPYFHDGSLETLRDVVEWFDDKHRLQLTPQEVDDLTAYLEAVGEAEEPYEVFDDENTPFALAWAELSTFLSTLDTLIPARDATHALLLLDTVGPDLRLDASAAQDRSVIPKVYEIADAVAAIRAAIAAGDWPAAAARYENYKSLAELYGPSLR
ncbi:MAG: cytochrome C [Acidobacteria bacterium]|nr:MAG: cytochrome C [Acidobacteriota bacterium]